MGSMGVVLEGGVEAKRVGKGADPDEEKVVAGSEDSVKAESVTPTDDIVVVGGVGAGSRVVIVDDGIYSPGSVGPSGANFVSPYDVASSSQVSGLIWGGKSIIVLPKL